MTFKKSLLAVALTFATNVTFATPITAPSLTVPSGSNVNVVWRAPMNQYYQVFVFVPHGATSTNAVYRIYPKGKKPRSTECVADLYYPCQEVSVNQALNQNKWVQLKTNTLDAWSFIGNKGYVNVTSEKSGSTENLGVSGIRFVASADLEIAALWSKTIAETAALKAAIGECLNDNSGNYAKCDELTNTEIGMYGITALPKSSDATFSLLKENKSSDLPQYFAIHIVGNKALDNCTFQLRPFVNVGAGTITWSVLAMIEARCLKYVKGSVGPMFYPD